MTEEIIGWQCSHGLCPSLEHHDVVLRRELIVEESAMAMNIRGVDFQPDQVWAAKRTRRRYAPRAVK